MNLTLTRSLLILAIPLLAGGMYAYSRRCPGHAAAEVCPADGSAACCCCEVSARSLLVLAAAQPQAAGGTEAPMFGGTPQRNMVNTTDTGIPAEWDVEKGKTKNLRWVAQLGNKSYGGPVIAGGK